MADVWDQFPDAPAQVAAGDDPWAQFPDAQSAAPAAAMEQSPPEKRDGLLKSYYGAMWEPLLSMGSSVISTPISGLAGAAQGVKNLVSPGMTAGNRVEAVRDAMTYQPRTQAGQAITGVVAYPFEKLAQLGDVAGDVANAPDKPVRKISAAAANYGLDPVVRQERGATERAVEGAIVNTAVQSIPALLTRRVGGNAGPRPSRPVTPAASGEGIAAGEAATAAQRAARLAKVPEKAPSIEELATQKSAAYEAATDAGLTISREGLNRLKVEIVNDLKRVRVNEKLHPKTAAVIEEIVKTKGPQTLQQIDELRQLANDAKGTADRADAFRGARVVDRIDSFLDELGPSEISAGDVAGAESLVRARELNTRLRKAEDIAELMDRAKTKAGANYTQSGLENAIRKEFQALALNKSKLRRFAPEEQQAIKDIARGSPFENALRNLGKFDPTTGGMAAAISAFLAGGGAAATGGASLLIPVAGFAAKRAATRMASRKVSTLDEMVRRGRGAQNALAYQRAPNALSKAEQP